MTTTPPATVAAPVVPSHAEGQRTESLTPAPRPYPGLFAVLCGAFVSAVATWGAMGLVLARTFDDLAATRAANPDFVAESQLGDWLFRSADLNNILTVVGAFGVLASGAIIAQRNRSRSWQEDCGYGALAGAATALVAYIGLVGPITATAFGSVVLADDLHFLRDAIGVASIGQQPLEAPQKSFAHRGGEVSASVKLLQDALPSPVRVRLQDDSLRLVDLRGANVELTGVPRSSPDLAALLDGLQAAHDPQMLAGPLPQPFVDFWVGKDRPKPALLNGIYQLSLADHLAAERPTLAGQKPFQQALSLSIATFAKQLTGNTFGVWISCGPLLLFGGVLAAAQTASYGTSLRRGEPLWRAVLLYIGANTIVIGLGILVVTQLANPA